MERILAPSRDPAFNLAAEEFLLSRFPRGDYLMLWVNDPAVIVGKFQNPYGEVSLNLCRAAGIPVVRRNSGGGTVYHDRGNLNYTVLTDRGEDFPDFARFLAPVVSLLLELGVEAEIRDTSALFAGGKKFSGSAQSNLKNRLLHHGTLLFDADLEALCRVTGHARETVVSKAIRSNPSPVTNLKPLLSAAGREMTMEDFASLVSAAFAPDTVRSFTEAEREEIGALADAKYRSWEWNFGRSPAFSVGLPGLSLEAKNGVILSCRTELCDPQRLLGLRLIPEEIEAVSPEAAALLFG